MLVSGNTSSASKHPNLLRRFLSLSGKIEYKDANDKHPRGELHIANRSKILVSTGMLLNIKICEPAAIKIALHLFYQLIKSRCIYLAVALYLHPYPVLSR